MAKELRKLELFRVVVEFVVAMQFGLCVDRRRQGLYEVLHVFSMFFCLGLWLDMYTYSLSTV